LGALLDKCIKSLKTILDVTVIGNAVCKFLPAANFVAQLFQLLDP
jgi:hypothetical protein